MSFVWKIIHLFLPHWIVQFAFWNLYNALKEKELVEDYQIPICEDESYQHIMTGEELYIPIIYDVYYGSTLIQANCSSFLTACLV